MTFSKYSGQQNQAVYCISTGLCPSLHGKNQSLKIMMVVEEGGGGGVALVTFNSRRPLPSTGIT